MAKKEYRNAIRSRNLIKQSLMELVKDNGIDDLTVTAVVNKAGVNRGTFYNHYSSLADVQDDIENDIADAFALIIKRTKEHPEAGPAVFYDDLTTYLKAHEDSFRSLCRYVPETLFQQMKSKIVEVVRASVFAEHPEVANNHHIYMALIISVNGLAETYMDYFSGRIDTDLDEIKHVMLTLSDRIAAAMPKQENQN